MAKPRSRKKGGGVRRRRKVAAPAAKKTPGAKKAKPVPVPARVPVPVSVPVPVPVPVSLPVSSVPVPSLTGAPVPAPALARLRRQEWAVAPTLLWFGVFVVAALVAADNVGALADRIAKRPERPATPPHVFGAATQVAGREAEPDEVPAAVAGGEAAASAVAGDDDGREAAAIPHLVDVCVDGTPERCRRWAMDAAYQAIADLQDGRATRPVRVSYYGDSVISTDRVPARIRTLLQKQLGDGGPGFVFAARPHRFVRHEVVATTNIGSWTAWGVSTSPAPDGLHGIAGSSAETVGGSVRYASETPVREVDVYYLRQPGGGRADVVLDGTIAASIDTAGDTKQARFERVRAATPAQKIEVRATGKVRLFGLVLENPSGVVVDNMGLVSATVKNAAHNRADHWRNQLAHRSADLVLVMLGANEAAWLPPSKTAMAEYRTRYEALLAPIREALPQTSCLVVSPLDQAQDAGGGLSSRPVMPAMVAAQRAAAAAKGCAFFSAYQWAGGKGSSIKWHRQGLVDDDFTHLSMKGAKRLGNAITNALIAGARGRRQKGQ